MANFECDDDIFSPVRYPSLDCSTSSTPSIQDSLLDDSNIDSSVLSVKDFTEFQNELSSETRYIGKNRCPSSFSEDSSGTKSTPPNQQQNTNVQSSKSDVSDFLHKFVLRKEVNQQNVNVRNKTATKKDGKFIGPVHIKKTYCNILRENDETKLSVSNVSSKKEINRTKTPCLNESNILPISKDSNNCASSSSLNENKKGFVTSATQTEISFEELISFANNSINKNSADINERDVYSTDVPMNHHQVSIKKIIHDSVSTECDKVRQLLYAQRMSSFRRIDQILAQHEFRIMMMQERLLKTVEELAQIYVHLNKSSTV